jgi:hypothetical protein
MSAASSAPEWPTPVSRAFSLQRLKLTVLIVQLFPLLLDDGLRLQQLRVLMRYCLPQRPHLH